MSKVEKISAFLIQPRKFVFAARENCIVVAFSPDEINLNAFSEWHYTMEMSFEELCQKMEEYTKERAQSVSYAGTATVAYQLDRIDQAVLLLEEVGEILEGINLGEAAYFWEDMFSEKGFYTALETRRTNYEDLLTQLLS